MGGKRRPQQRLSIKASLRKCNISSIFNDDYIQERFLNDYAQKKFSPATIKSYLTSIAHFCDFWLSKKSQDVGYYDPEAIRTTRDKVKRWGASYRKECGKRKWQKMEEELADIITPQNINDFERSSAAREAISMLGIFSGAHNIDLTQHKFTVIRDFLIAEILFNNASRSGALANMKVEELERARKEEGVYVVGIQDHKTVHIHGAAQISLNESIYAWLQIYMKEIRAQVLAASPSGSNSGCAYVFVTWNTEKMTSSQITA